MEVLWYLTTQKNLDSVFRLQKKVSESLTLQLLINILTLYFLDDRIIKFPDVIKLNLLCLSNSLITKLYNVN